MDDKSGCNVDIVHTDQLITASYGWGHLQSTSLNTADLPHIIKGTLHEVKGFYVIKAQTYKVM